MSTNANIFEPVNNITPPTGGLDSRDGSLFSGEAPVDGIPLVHEPLGVYDPQGPVEWSRRWGPQALIPEGVGIDLEVEVCGCNSALAEHYSQHTYTFSDRPELCHYYGCWEHDVFSSRMLGPLFTFSTSHYPFIQRSVKNVIKGLTGAVLYGGDSLPACLEGHVDEVPYVSNYDWIKDAGDLIGHGCTVWLGNEVPVEVVKLHFPVISFVGRGYLPVSQETSKIFVRAGRAGVGVYDAGLAADIILACDEAVSEYLSRPSVVSECVWFHVSRHKWYNTYQATARQFPGLSHASVKYQVRKTFVPAKIATPFRVYRSGHAAAKKHDCMYGDLSGCTLVLAPPFFGKSYFVRNYEIPGVMVDVDKLVCWPDEVSSVLRDDELCGHLDDIMGAMGDRVGTTFFYNPCPRMLAYLANLPVRVVVMISNPEMLVSNARKREAPRNPEHRPYSSGPSVPEALLCAQGLLRFAKKHKIPTFQSFSSLTSPYG